MFSRTKAVSHLPALTDSPASPAPEPYWPTLSVVVPIYNGAGDVAPLMACLQGQSYPRDRVEYLLVDNNSSDDTSEQLRQSITAANGQGFCFRYCYEATIQSAYAARNCGIRAAHHDIIAFTDADCRPQPQWLEALVQPLADPAIGLVLGEIAGAPGKTWLERYANYCEVLSQRHTFNHSFLPYGQTANLAVRARTFAEVGLFRPYLTTGGDADMCWRIQQGTDYRLAFATEAVVEHCHRTTLAALRSQWERYGRSNQYLHQLHGIPLMRRPSRRSLLRGVLHWLIKGLPLSLMGCLGGRQPAIGLIAPLLTLYCGWYRYRGQQQAQLPEVARQIEWLGLPMDRAASAVEAIAHQRLNDPLDGSKAGPGRGGSPPFIAA